MRQILTSLRYHWCRASRPRGWGSWPGRRAESAPAPWGLETWRERGERREETEGEQTQDSSCLHSGANHKRQEIKLAQRQLLLEDSNSLCRKDNFIVKILRCIYTNTIYIHLHFTTVHFYPFSTLSISFNYQQIGILFICFYPLRGGTYSNFTTDFSVWCAILHIMIFCFDQNHLDFK